jgi:hypothetical protein
VADAEGSAEAVGFTDSDGVGVGFEVGEVVGVGVAVGFGVADFVGVGFGEDDFDVLGFGEGEEDGDLALSGPGGDAPLPLLVPLFAPVTTFPCEDLWSPECVPSDFVEADDAGLAAEEDGPF